MITKNSNFEPNFIFRTLVITNPSDGGQQHSFNEVNIYPKGRCHPREKQES